MGQSPSTQIRDNTHGYMQGSSVRLAQDRDMDILDLQNDFLPSESFTPLLKTGFAGTWSVYSSEDVYPCPRTGQFSVHCPARNSLIIGYGINSENVPLNDVWELNIADRTWHQLSLTGDVITPRAFASACIGNSAETIFVFGGIHDTEYFADFHSIDLQTGVVSMIETCGEAAPCPRQSPLIACYENSLFLWGGYDGSWPALVHKLDLSSMSWSSYDPGFCGRNYIPFAVYEDKLYGYGCSKSGGFIVINMSDCTADIQKADGNCPPSEFMAAGMLAIDQYLVYFGGKSEDEYSLVYACDMNSMRWFPFWIIPDSETVSSSDGNVDETGVFHIPRMYGFSTCYSPDTREIISCLGYPESNPPIFSVFSIGEALSILHLRDDLLDTLWSNH